MTSVYIPISEQQPSAEIKTGKNRVVYYSSHGNMGMLDTLTYTYARPTMLHSLACGNADRSTDRHCLPHVIMLAFRGVGGVHCIASLKYAPHGPSRPRLRWSADGVMGLLPSALSDVREVSYHQLQPWKTWKPAISLRLCRWLFG